MQTAMNEHQIVFAAEITGSLPTSGSSNRWSRPPAASCTDRRSPIGRRLRRGRRLLASAQMERVINMGIQVLIPPDAGKRASARPGWDGGRYAFMRPVLASEHGGGLYKRRQAMVEPVFAQTKLNRGINRFHSEADRRRASEWRLITATHNLLKLHKHQIATSGA